MADNEKVSNSGIPIYSIDDEKDAAGNFVLRANGKVLDTYASEAYLYRGYWDQSHSNPGSNHPEMEDQIETILARKAQMLKDEHFGKNAIFNTRIKNGSETIEDGDYYEHNEYDHGLLHGNQHPTWARPTKYEFGERSVSATGDKFNEEIAILRKVKEGKEMSFYLNGLVQTISKFENGILHGKCITLNSIGGEVAHETNYRRGEKHGREVEYDDYTQDILKEINFDSGVRHGQSIENFPSRINEEGDQVAGGIKRSRHYDDGQLDGLCAEYYESGQEKSLENWQLGKSEGAHKGFYEDGSLKYEFNFKNGEKHGPRVWYFEDGQVSVSENYKDGKKHGTFINYAHDGSTQFEENYKDGQRHGASKTFFPNGNLEHVQNHKNGVQDGEWISYYHNGNEKVFGVFKDGEETGERVWYSESGEVESDEYTSDDGTKISRFYDTAKVSSLTEDGEKASYFKVSSLTKDGEKVSSLMLGLRGIVNMWRDNPMFPYKQARESINVIASEQGIGNNKSTTSKSTSH
jgi:antitoxin component YwqK of YwqJK toxin-antitoxin module